MTESVVFVSYAHKDRPLRDALAGELAEWGIKVWSDEKLRAGESFNERIAHALYKARAVVLVSSGNSMDSEYVKAEITFAHKLGKTICEVSVAGNRHPDLTDIQRVDFEVPGGSWPDVVSELAPTLKRAIGPSEIFIAHELAGDPDERSFVEWVAAELSEQGLDVWYEQDRIEFGDDREGKVHDAIDRSGVILAILSEVSSTSERFSQHVGRALMQSDEVLCIIHRSSDVTRKELIDRWRTTLAEVFAEDRFLDMILDRFERVARLEPAVFIDATRDAQRMAQVAKGLRKRQEAFRPDDKVEEEVARVFKDFMETMSERGFDVAQVLSLPDYKLAAMEEESAAAVGESGGHLRAVESSAATPGSGDAALEAPRVPKFCRKCGTPTTPGDTVCRNCQQSLMPD